ncbi:MAG: S8 family serine peptidase [Armatimonadetes bacterium]|nr:S8 family serine peptidase [Armatimonadota bacterium]
MKVLVSLLVAFFCLYLHSIPNNEVLFRDSGDCVSISGSSSFPVNQTTIVNETLLDTLLYYNAESLEKVFPSFNSEDIYATNFWGMDILLNDLSNIYKITTSDSINAHNLIYTLSNDTTFYYIDYAESSYCPISDDGEISSVRVVPDDELFPQQWYLYNNGQPGDINILDAWDISMGDENIKTGIIELGYAYQHEDMSGRLKYSGGSYASSHATGTTGLITANHNNNYIAGVTATCKSRSYGFGSGNDNICNAFNSAFDNNCRILNNSWGYLTNPPYTTILNIDNLIRQGVLFVCSSGNTYGSSRRYPSAYPLPGILAVGASTKFFERASYSTYHDRLDLVAPGGEGPNYLDKMILLNLTNSYCYNTGTSFSSPLVSGAAALCLSLNPNLYPEDIEHILKQTANSDINVPGWDSETGHGILDVHNVLSYIQNHTFEHFSVTNISGQLVQSWYHQHFYETFKVPNGIYYAKRYKIETDIDFIPNSDDFEIWPISINAGFRDNSPGDGFNNSEIVNIDYVNNTCTVRTYAFKLRYTDGTFFRWFPCEPSDIILEITVSSDLYGTSIDNQATTLMNYELHSNHPNPFNPSTIISYSLVDNINNPQIEIYNIKGQRVKSFQLEEKAGESSIVWNGKDENDKSVSSGVYFYRLINEEKTIQNKKMLLIK